MSNRNQNTQNPNPNGANGGNGAAPDNGGKQPEEKESLTTKIIKVKNKIKASKAGRVGIKILKGLGVGGVAYLSYKAGVKSVRPTTIYIKDGVTEDEPEDEPTEETPEPEDREEE